MKLPSARQLASLALLRLRRASNAVARVTHGPIVDRVILFFAHPVVSVFAAGVSLAFALRALFLSVSEWLWHFAGRLDLNEFVPWVRFFMGDRDGAEPYGLLAVVVLQLLGTAVSLAVLLSISRFWRACTVLVLLGVSLLMAWRIPLSPPEPTVGTPLSTVVWLVADWLLAAWLLRRVTLRSRRLVPLAVAIVLVPICFVPISATSLADLICILSPALRLQYGFPLSQIYMQYDLLPSLLVLAWTKLGGAPVAFSLVISAIFYAFFLGIFALARRLFRAELVAPFMISLLIVRFYAIEGDVTPQVTPMRLDLWMLVVALVLRVGLHHWLVGLLLGGLCFFSRSIGILYVGAYALAVAIDFLALRRATPRAQRPAWPRALSRLVLKTAPVWGLVLLAFLVVRLVFGAFGSDAVALYRKLGIGMMRIDSKSFYWWLLALTGIVGWLTYTRRSAMRGRTGEAAIVAVALMVGSSLYFFGRSHEHNLLNISASLLFCFFLALDLAWPAEGERAPALRLLLRPLPWLLVAVTAYYYSGRVYGRVIQQVTALATQSPVTQATSGDPVPSIDCAEIARAAGDDRVYFFSVHDYWYYEQCKYAPIGYFQPMYLGVLKEPLVVELKDWLAHGYKIFVPRASRDSIAITFDDFLPDLPALKSVDTPNFVVYHAR